MMVELNSARITKNLLERVAELKERKYVPGGLNGYKFLETEGGRFGYVITPTGHDDSLLFSVYWEMYARTTNFFLYEELRETGNPDYADYREGFVIRAVTYVDGTDDGDREIFLSYDVYSTILERVVRVEVLDNGLAIVGMWTDDEYLREVGRKAFDGVEKYECNKDGVVTRV